MNVEKPRIVLYTHNVKKKRRRLRILLLIFIVVLGVFSLVRTRQLNSVGTIPLPTTSPSEAADQADSSKPIITCQNTVITGKTTTELYTYTSESKFRADYRIKTNDNQVHYSSQIYFDGGNIYSWNPTVIFDPQKDTVNTSGFFKRAVTFHFDTGSSTLNTITRFNDSGVSGVRVCKDFAPPEPVFQLPFNIQFMETPEYLKEIRANIRGICKPCTGIRDTKAADTCRQFLGCNF